VACITAMKLVATDINVVLGKISTALAGA